MKKIYAVFCDLDGTLLDNKTKYPHPLFLSHYLAFFKEKKIPFIPITGRLFSETLTIFKHLNKDSQAIPYIVSSNGSQIYDTRNQKFILNDVFDQETIKEIYDAIIELNAFNPQTQVLFYKNTEEITFWPSDARVFKSLKNSKALDSLIANQHNHTFVRVDPEGISHTSTILHNSVEPKILDQLELKNLDNLNKIVIIVFNSHFQELLKFLKNHLGQNKNLDFSFSSSHSVEISLAKHTKGDSLEKVAKLLKINLDHCLICGDSGNDISMFKKQPITSCCPTWANDLVKSHAGKSYDGLASEWVLKAFDNHIIKKV